MLSEYILRMSQYGGKTAFIEQGLYRSRAFTYAQVVERARAFAAWLDAKNLSRRNVADPPRVLIWAAPGARWAMAFYGCVLAGSVPVPVDAGFSADFLGRIAAQTNASLLIADEERVRAPAPSTFPPQIFPLEKIESLPAASAGFEFPPAAGRDLLAEIVYTSGTTSEPRGVMITHGNLLANIEPVEREIRRYWRLSLPFRPIRFLNLIPLSHLFGQVMGLFMPQLLHGEVVFPAGQGPAQLARIIKERRISVMVSVPQQLEALGSWALAQLNGSSPSDAQAECDRAIAESWSLRKRWWRFRRVHRALGWKMWAFVVGGARLPARVESLWNALGYAVIQGYGLTETAPAITITHPFKSRRGAVGKPLPGTETRIADDGEILVRGANVSPGYYGNPDATRALFADGWLHTGDLGRFDDDGNLVYLGRKKEMIVTAEGLNVFPEDVEQALAVEASVREAAVVGKESGDAATASRTLVHAVVVPAAGAGAAEIESSVERANRSLEPHQRIRGFSLWPGSELPRTASTGKIQRTAIAAWVNSARPASTAPRTTKQDWRSFLESLGVAADRMRPEARLTEDLGLSSLDRVELMTWIESQGIAIDEETIARAQTIADIEAATSRGTSPPAHPKAATGSQLPGASTQPAVVAQAASASPNRRAHAEPRWPTAWPVRAGRVLKQWCVAFPLLRYYVRLERVGLENLAPVRGPVIFVCNHQSFFDAPVIFRALPSRFRCRLAPAMSEEVFRRHNPFWLFLTRIYFNGYLISGNPARAQEALRHAGWLAERGFSTLIFPEGERTADGKLKRFRPGVGVLAERLQLPVVTLRLDGLFEAWPSSRFWPHHGRARVTVGETFRLEPGETAADFTARLENYYRNWR